MGEGFRIFEQDDNIGRKGHKKLKCQNLVKKQYGIRLLYGNFYYNDYKVCGRE